MPIPFRLEYAIDQTLDTGSRAAQRELRRLAGVRLAPEEARRLWPAVLEHKWYMSERLGRDVGARVAAIDYFENVRLPRARRAGGESIIHRLRRAAQPQGTLA